MILLWPMICLQVKHASYYMETNIELNYLEKLGKGDHGAFDFLFTIYYPKVKSFLFGFIKDADMASDMAQDIFFKVWTNREAISKTISFKSYLFRMAKNMVYDYYEHQSVKEKYDLKQQEQYNHYYADIIDIEENMYVEELSLLIDMLIGKMPAQRKRIFIMSRKEGYTNDEIADRLKINKRTVENHLTQALHDIRTGIAAP
jgi:RNA polymerase sigma-70 factor (ECF subfamily)